MNMPVTNMPAAKSVLFVCLGNICRSPMAEGAMRQLADTNELDLNIDSADTAGYHIGNPPDPRSIAQAAKYGADIRNLRARQVSRDDFYDFDLIIAMDRSNFDDLSQLAPKDAKAKLILALDWVAGLEGQSVPDPYYDDAQGFAHVWQLVSQLAMEIPRRLLGSGP